LSTPRAPKIELAAACRRLASLESQDGSKLQDCRCKNAQIANVPIWRVTIRGCPWHAQDAARGRHIDGFFVQIVLLFFGGAEIKDGILFVGWHGPRSPSIYGKSSQPIIGRQTKLIWSG
jgi:hypothetical protein